MSLRRLLLLIFSLAFVSMEAQRSGHFINNYLPTDYRGFNQVWQAAQDKNGVMYFAGTSAVYVYDGQQWETVPVRPGAANRQIVLDSATNTMYIGAVSEFGFLERQNDGRLRYHSLSDSLSGNAKIFSDVWKVYVLDGCVYFQASERIFVVKDKKIIRIIEAPENKTFAFAFAVGEKLFIRQRNVGFVELKNDSMLSMCCGEPTPRKRLPLLIAIRISCWQGLILRRSLPTEVFLALSPFQRLITIWSRRGSLPFSGNSRGR